MERIVSVKGNLHDKCILKLLSYSVYMPTEMKMSKRADKYEKDDNIFVYGYFEEETIKGVIALKRLEGASFEIIGIAVDPACRGNRIGGRLISHAMNDLNCETLLAETDDDAIGFYRKRGFQIENLGEKYEGIIRYSCTLTRI